MKPSRIETAGSPEFFLWGAGAITAAQASIFALDHSRPTAIAGQLYERVCNIANERAERIARALGSHTIDAHWRYVSIGVNEGFENCQEILEFSARQNMSALCPLVAYRASLSSSLATKLQTRLILTYPHQTKNILNTVARLKKEDEDYVRKLRELQQYENNPQTSYYVDPRTGNPR